MIAVLMSYKNSIKMLGVRPNFSSLAHKTLVLSPQSIKTFVFVESIIRALPRLPLPKDENLIKYLFKIKKVYF